MCKSFRGLGNNYHIIIVGNLTAPLDKPPLAPLIELKTPQNYTSLVLARLSGAVVLQTQFVIGLRQQKEHAVVAVVRLFGVNETMPGLSSLIALDHPALLTCADHVE